MQIPQPFQDFILTLFGDEGRAWVEHLPTLLTSYQERWQFTLDEPVSNLTFNYVAPAVMSDGTRVILKTGLTDEFPAQPQALQHFAGHGMVRLLAYDADDSIMLLERLQPGHSLRTIKNDEQVISATAEVMRALWRPLERDHPPFPTVQDWGRGFARIRARYGTDTGLLSPKLYDRGERLYMELAASMDTPVLLHGDLHQDNILSAERAPWLAIDPKGLIGEPAYETGAILRNFWPDILKQGDPQALMKRRIDQLSAELGLARERIYGWGFSQAVLSALWNLEDQGAITHSDLFFIEALAGIQNSYFW